MKQVDGLPLLIRCATESHFDPAKVQLNALDIIMSLAFNEEIGTCLRQNNTFVQHLRTLTSTSNTPYLQKAADGILWQLFSKYGNSEREFQYDIMISYSHKDKDICHRIYKVLIANKFRVWIDLEEMHGAMMQVMADAIKHSRCILICMSESYFMSPYCQSEAQFAFEKRRILIPLRVQSGYKADGWLAFLTSGRIYVDFTKMDFDTAYAKVASEVLRSQANPQGSSVILSGSIVAEASTIK
ncbi:unnamed protein product [Rotaria sp. Silwood1]|nr:unnamed protein product [Rotaria sp. Silwood1]